MVYHDLHSTYTLNNTIPGATPWTGNYTYGQIPIQLRDDPWNTYTFDPETGRAHFHWYWLECCTDGMVIGPLPKPDRENILWNITWEGHCDSMVGLEQGTRIQQW